MGVMLLAVLHLPTRPHVQSKFTHMLHVAFDRQQTIETHSCSAVQTSRTFYWMGMCPNNQNRLPKVAASLLLVSL